MTFRRLGDISPQITRWKPIATRLFNFITKVSLTEEGSYVLTELESLQKEKVPVVMRDTCGYNLICIPEKYSMEDPLFEGVHRDLIDIVVNPLANELVVGEQFVTQTP